MVLGDLVAFIRLAEKPLTIGIVAPAGVAGLEPGTLNPLVVEVMREAGLDISKKGTQAVFDVFKSGQLFTYVITVCSEAEAGGCPIFPGPTKRLHWPFPDPSKVEGTLEEKMEKIRQIRDAIQARIEQFCAEYCARLSESGRTLRRPRSSDRPG